MADLSVKYMGIELKNPVIVGACNLVTSEENMKRMEEAGASAIVYKSLFEEQVQLESLQLSEELGEYNERHAEMIGLFPDVEHAGPEEYLINLKKAVKSVDIPVFGSLNAIEFETWVDYAKKIEETGVAGLEANFYFVPEDFEISGKAIIQEQLDILEGLKKNLNIPVAVKLSPYYTNVLYVINEMDKLGADAFVFFNRLFQPEIDIDNETHHFPYNLSQQEDNRYPLRIAGLLYDNIKANICASRGIFTGEDAISMIMAGADCVQVVSTIYKHKIEQITNILRDINLWMESKKYKNLQDFRGNMSRKNYADPFAYKRAQYVDILMKSDEIYKKYPMV